MMRIRMAGALGLMAAVAMSGGLLRAATSNAQLIDAVKREDVAAVRGFVAQHADVNAPEADGSTALHWAAQRNNLEIAGLLLGAGAKVNAATRYNVTPLALAATNGNAAMIERLLQAGADANSTSSEGQTALMTAARNGSVAAVKVLLTHGAQVNTKEPFRGQTALMWAAGEGNAAAAEMLIEFGADAKTTSKTGFTALLFAVRNHHTDTAKALLAHGANVEDRAPDGTTALNMSVVNGYYDLASVLLDFHANPNAPDPNGSPLHSLAWLRKPGTPWEAAGLGEDPIGPPKPTGNVTSEDLAKKLLAHGEDPNIRIAWKEMRMTKGLGTTSNPPNVPLGRHYLSFVGATPFYVAARNGDAPLMRLLVEGGADPKIPTAVGVTPLMAAAGLDYYEGETPGPFNGTSEAERLEAVKLCVELGANINARTDFGDYPVIGSPEFTLMTYPLNAEELFGLGVGDPRFTGMTALHGAVISNQPSIVQYLVDQGAELDATSNFGWTPLMVSRGIFMANSKKEFPAAEKILLKALKEKGLLAAGERSKF
ncbi:MAG: ankyrin repeat domain-containing protein [Acidobacteriia bacterium]|nr:ankyrin repeat domain-containing protein [Terriglobia bacterium]